MDKAEENISLNFKNDKERQQFRQDILMDKVKKLKEEAKKSAILYKLSKEPPIESLYCFTESQLQQYISEVSWEEKCDTCIHSFEECCIICNGRGYLQTDRATANCSRCKGTGKRSEWKPNQEESNE